MSTDQSVRPTGADSLHCLADPPLSLSLFPFRFGKKKESPSTMSSATIPFIEALESTITRTKSSLSAATVPTVQRPESLPFTCSTTQTFAQLALRQSITWTQVDAALELHFSHLVVGVVASDPTSASSSSSSSSWAIAAAGELVTLSSAIQGEFGLALVCRVLRRFVGYEDLNEERRCIDWCRKLERAVAA